MTLFGPMAVRVDGDPLPRLRSRKILWLLALLTLRGGRPVERGWLSGTLWPDIDQSAASANLRVVLSELRRALGSQGGRLQSPSRHTLSLDLDGADVDVRLFDETVNGQDIAALTQAVELYRGPLLEGCAEEWVGQERGMREQQCLQALLTLADTALAAQDSRPAAEYYRRAVGLDPWREEAQRGLMQALVQGGDANAALDTYKAFVRELRRDDPKAAPDAQTTALYTRLRVEARQRASQPPIVAAEEVVTPEVTGYLPHALTDLVGREDEREEVVERLRRSRLVTLTGPGGIGKTRLALAVAAQAAHDYAGGVWLVALDALSDGGQIPAQIAGVLRVKEEPGRTPLESLTEHLRDKRLLLVLDNCEHVLGDSAQIAGHLLGECAGMRLLTTSREALGVTGEAVWPVPALAVPDEAHLPAGHATLVRVLAGYDGVQLFVERAQTIQKTFSLSGSNAVAVAQVCGRLGGLPLAIELAAARTRMMTVAQIAARLDDRLSLLTDGSRAAPSRHQTLRATLDWSYSLLGDTERALLARLSVFAGGWTLEAAEAVCAGGDIAAHQVLDLMAGLVDKSLVVFEEQAGAGRYRFLETIRQYAAEKVEATGDAATIRSCHRDFFLALAEEADPQLRGPDYVDWLRRLGVEYANFRVALERGEHGAMRNVAGLRLANALYQFWWVRGDYAEGQHFLALTLAQAGPEADTGLRAATLSGMAALALHQGNYDETETLYRECLRIYRTSGDTVKAASMLGKLSSLAIRRGDFAGAQPLLDECLSIQRAANNRQGIATILGDLGSLAHYRNEMTSARAWYEESLSLARELDDPSMIQWALLNLCTTVQAQGDSLTAYALASESLALAREAGAKSSISEALLTLGEMAHTQGDAPQAQAYFEESLGLSQSLGNRRNVAWSFLGLGEAARSRSETASATALYEQGLDLFRVIGDRIGEGAVLRGLGDAAQDRRNLPSAKAFYRESLEILKAGGDNAVLSTALNGLAGVLLGEGDARGAVRLLGASAILGETTTLQAPLNDRERYTRQMDQARVTMGPDGFAEAWAEGCALTWEQAADYALGKTSNL